MLTLLRNGGYPPMLFILLTGLVGVGAAFHFALRAQRSSIGFIQWLAAATLFGTLAATFADLGTVFYAASRLLEAKGESAALPTATHLLIEGVAESTSPGILGFSFLAVIALLVAVGRRRLAHREGV